MTSHHGSRLWRSTPIPMPKTVTPTVGTTVRAHREDILYLEGAYRVQLNGEIQGAYNALGRYEELADPKYTDLSGIFDIMAITVIDHSLQKSEAA